VLQSAVLPDEVTKGFSLAQMGKDATRAETFLLTLYDTGRHDPALRAVGLFWSVISRWRSSCADFEGMYQRVLSAVNTRRVQQARDELHRRAVDGVDKPVFQQGRQVGVIREYSDKLLETELKALDPATFGPPETATGSGVRVTINLDMGVSGDLTATIAGQQSRGIAQPVEVKALAPQGDTGMKPAALPQGAQDAIPADVADACAIHPEDAIPALPATDTAAPPAT
jgi:hypothetical protein